MRQWTEVELDTGLILKDFAHCHAVGVVSPGVAAGGKDDFGCNGIRICVFCFFFAAGAEKHASGRQNGECEYKTLFHGVFLQKM